MAIMIPEIDVATIENDGEKSFYEAASLLPDQYTVYYGYKYLQEISNHLVREADFIIIHPQLGFLVVEVKQGDIAFHNGQWHEVKQGGYLPLHKNPVEQARSAMFHILRHYRINHQNQDFPLQAKYVLCFPDCTTMAGSMPIDLLAESVWLKQNMNNIEASIQSLLGTTYPQKSSRVGESLIKMLSPDFKLFTVLKDQIVSFSKSSLRILNDEQERIIDETLLDKRKLFLGTAGTGKTFIAIEKARRSVLEGKKVLLTCFNKHLANWMKNQMVNLDLSIDNFHDFLEKYLQDRQSWTAPDPDEKDAYYQTYLAEQGYDYFTRNKESEKFDCIIIDEGQDFQEDWILCLENMLKEEGELYIFADPNQNLFHTHDWSILQRYTASTHRLTQNLRNTEPINEWTRPFISGYVTKSKIAGGMQVQTFSWNTPEQQKRLIEKEIGRLISQGIPPKNITILSPHRRENGGLQGTNKIKEWPLVDFNIGQYGIQYATIRSFKGLETDILFLIDIKLGNITCTPADVYVGASRARFLLYVFNHEDWHRPEKSR